MHCFKRPQSLHRRDAIAIRFVQYLVNHPANLYFYLIITTIFLNTLPSLKEHLEHFDSWISIYDLQRKHVKLSLKISAKYIGECMLLVTLSQCDQNGWTHI